jgi:hypothetical protein
MKTLADFYRLFPSRPAMAIAVRPARAPILPVEPANDPVVEPNDAARRYRSRDFGTGYGRSSGYAQDRSYTEGRGDRMLRVG